MIFIIYTSKNNNNNNNNNNNDDDKKALNFIVLECDDSGCLTLFDL